MGDVGLLLSLPTDSIAVRVALASLVAVVAGRLLLRSRLRTARVRATVALLPALAVALVAIAYASSPALPSLWTTVDATGGLSIPVQDTYLSFAPLAVPLLVALWAVVAGGRLAVRTLRARRLSRSLRQLAAVGDAPASGLVARVQRLAAALQVPPPETRLVPDLRGGAAVVGVRSPLLLLDRALVERLDEDELEGVLAHELAHVARRDNLVAAALGVLRDVFFFVPAGSWSLRGLLREREHAADTAAVDLTGRPGALASGLLKVIEAAGGGTPEACSPLLSEGTLVSRVEELCTDRPPATRRRKHGESAVTVVALTISVVAAGVVPDVIAGQQRQRDALGVLFSDVQADPAAPATSSRSVVFTAFDEAGATAAQTSEAGVGEAPASTFVLPLDDPEAFAPQGLAACGLVPDPCAEPGHDLRMLLVPERIERVDSDLVSRWRLDPVMRSQDEQVGLFWFQRQAVS